jgi:hypothetical protein
MQAVFSFLFEGGSEILRLWNLGHYHQFLSNTYSPSQSAPTGPLHRPSEKKIVFGLKVPSGDGLDLIL